MHSEIEVTAPALDMLRERWSRPLMAYAVTGRFTLPDRDFSQAAGPDAYADWVAHHGVAIVGGCCGTAPYTRAQGTSCGLTQGWRGPIVRATCGEHLGETPP